MATDFPGAPDAGKAFDAASNDNQQPPPVERVEKIATKAEQERLETQREVPGQHNALPPPTPPGGEIKTADWQQAAIRREEEIKRIQQSRDAASQQFRDNFQSAAPESEEDFIRRMRERNAERGRSREQSRDEGLDL